jgi:PTH1 family peptidyl-tRNA hydrolase
MAESKRRRDEPRRGTPADLLVVGLGNPGTEYTRTRHNVGFEVIDVLAARHGGRLKKGKEKALVTDVRIGTARVALAAPQTFMNLSGESVAPLVRRYGIDDLHHLVIVHDELDLPLGRLKMKVGGGLAGHNGLRSIKAHLHDADFVRIRIGVGKPPHKDLGADHVLKKVGKAERTVLDEVVGIAADAVEYLLDHDLDDAMSRFNATDLTGDATPADAGPAEGTRR